MDFQIDYLLFLALTGRKSGDQGWWKFDATGIRSTLREGGHSAHDDFQTHRLIEGTRLDFPAVASELRRVEENLQERLTPDWFRALLACTSKDDASAVLAAAHANGVQAREEAIKRKVAASTDESLSRSERVHATAWEEQMAREAELALHGVELVAALVSNSDTGPTPSPDKIGGAGNRSGGIGQDILSAAKKVGAPWATAQVRAELERMAQATEGCMFDVAPNGILYKNADGEDQVLTWAQLSGRMVGVRKTLRKT